MFDILPNTLTLLLSILLPSFATYKALRSTAPPRSTYPPSAPPTNTILQSHNATLRSWLIYHLVLTLSIAVESIISPITSFVPFFAYARLGWRVYLLAPGTAESLYGRLEAYLISHEGRIEKTITDAHDAVKDAVSRYVGDAVEFVRVTVLRREPTPPPPPANELGAYTLAAQTLLGRIGGAWSAGLNTQRFETESAPRPGDVWALLSDAVTGRAKWGVQEEAKTEPSVFDGLLNAAMDAGGVKMRSASGEGMKTSKSELDFEKISKEEARKTPPDAAASAGWSSWLWNSKGAGGEGKRKTA